MVDLAFFAFVLALGLGILTAYYYRTHRHTWGTLLGVTITILGGFLAFASATLSGPAIIIGGTLGMVAVFTLMFLTFGRDPRVLLLLGIPVVILVETYAYHALTLQLLLLEYMGLVVAVISAYDYSRVDITARVRIAGGLLRGSLWVFSFIHGLVERIVERPSRSIIAISYFTFISVILAVAPLLVAKLSGDAVPPEPLIIVGLVYFYLTREAIARTSQPNSSNPLK